MKKGNLNKSTETTKKATSKTANTSKTSKTAETSKIADNTKEKEAERKQRLEEKKQKDALTKQLEAKKKADEKRAKEEQEKAEIEAELKDNLAFLATAQKQNYFNFSFGIIPTEKEIIIIESFKESGKMPKTALNYKKIDLLYAIDILRPKNLKNAYALAISGEMTEITKEALNIMDSKIAAGEIEKESRSQFELFQAANSKKLPAFDYAHPTKELKLMEGGEIGQIIEIQQANNMRKKPAIIMANDGYTSVITVTSNFAAFDDEAIYSNSKFEAKEEKELCKVYGNTLIENLKLDFADQIAFNRELLEKQLNKDTKAAEKTAKAKEKTEKQNGAFEKKTAELKKAKDLKSLSDLIVKVRKSSFGGHIRKDQIKKLSDLHTKMKNDFEAKEKSEKEKAEKAPTLKEGKKQETKKPTTKAKETAKKETAKA